MSGPEAKPGHDGTRKAVFAALFANLGIAVAKLGAFLVSGSSAMLAESFHSAADTVNQVFLLLGLKLGKRAPDEEHPFGFGRERYFWAFIVALSIFSLGAVFSILEGLSKIRDPHPIQAPLVPYLALAIAAVFEGYALSVAWREFRRWRTRNPGPLWLALRRAKNPTVLVVIFEDSAALAGIVVAAAGIGLTLATGEAFWDGLASLVIGFILLVAAFFIGWRTRGLLIGEAATEADRQRIREAVLSAPHVHDIVEVLTLHLGPEDVLVNLNVNFEDGLTTDDLEAAVDEIESRIRAAVPAAKRIFIEAESIRRIG